MSGVPVRFAVVPFLPVYQPALGVSSLAAVLARAGVESRVDYFNVEYREQLGRELYQRAADGTRTTHLLGEMLFARALWGDGAPDWSRYCRRVLAELEEMRRSFRCVSFVNMPTPDDPEHRPAERALEAALADLEPFYESAPALVRRWAERIAATRPRVVGFSTTFQQNLAALAVAQALRRLAPPDEIAILFGGGNCEGEMGRAMAESFPFIDTVVSGEAEAVIADLVAGARAGRTLPRHVEGVRVEDMDALPVPVFDDYFAACRSTDLAWKSHLPAEASRGCWWGARSHCTFCGLNGTSMAFRSKGPERVAAELRTLADRYERRFFMMADNIMDAHYAETFMPLVAGDRLRLFFEVKANLRKEQLARMAAGGVVWIQPGIESLSTPILKLMGKGATRLINVQLLKWCAEYGVRASWNLLCGFPGEAPDEYRATAALMPLLVHLQPPAGVFPIRLDRFSPYFDDPERRGLVNVRPAWAYDLALAGLAPDARRRLAYFFEFDYADGRDAAGYVQDVLAAMDAWYRASWEGARLEIVETPEGPAVYDTRSGDRRVHRLTPLDLGILAALDTARTLGAAGELLRARGLDATPDAVAERAALLEDRGWLIREGHSWLSLVVDRPVTDRDRQVALEYLTGHADLVLEST
jgi:ribosomal peptide maturation radical SAM protein 1